MDLQYAAAVVANYLVMGGLTFYGFLLFADYFASGKWSKNVTGLLAGLGMFTLAFSLLLTPINADVIVRIAQTGASDLFRWVSTALLLSAIAAFGLITYSKPIRLWHERQIQRDLNRDLPKIP